MSVSFISLNLQSQWENVRSISLREDKIKKIAFMILSVAIVTYAAYRLFRAIYPLSKNDIPKEIPSPIDSKADEIPLSSPKALDGSHHDELVTSSADDLEKLNPIAATVPRTSEPDSTSQEPGPSAIPQATLPEVPTPIASPQHGRRESISSEESSSDPGHSARGLVDESKGDEFDDESDSELGEPNPYDSDDYDSQDELLTIKAYHNRERAKRQNLQSATRSEPISAFPRTPLKKRMVPVDQSGFDSPLLEELKKIEISLPSSKIPSTHDLSERKAKIPKGELMVGLRLPIPNELKGEDKVVEVCEMIFSAGGNEWKFTGFKEPDSENLNYGKLLYPDGMQYIGWFEDNLRTGRGKIIMPKDQETFIGLFKKDTLTYIKSKVSIAGAS